MSHRLAVLVSGTGRHLENLASLAADPAANFDAEVGVVISNRPGVGALEHAARYELRAEVLEGAEGETDEDYGRRVFDAIRDASGRTAASPQCPAPRDPRSSREVWREMQDSGD